MRNITFTAAVSTILIVFLTILTADAHAEQLRKYTRPDGLKCSAKVMDSGDLADIYRESGTEKTIVAVTSWDKATDLYTTTLYIVRGNEMKHLQYKETGECAEFTTTYFPDIMETGLYFGLNMFPSPVRVQKDPKTGMEELLPIRPIRESKR